jgi:DNA-binding XRE family transcriptional regulator
MVDPDRSLKIADGQLAEVIDGLARTGSEIDELTARLGRLTWEREQLMSLAWAQGINVRLIAKLAKASRMLAQQAAERHAKDLAVRRQDRALSARVELMARDRGLLSDDIPFYRRGVPLGEALYDLRRRRGMTQEQVAHTAGIDRGGYATIEQGRRAPTWRTVVKLANALDVSLEELAKAVGPDNRPDRT